MNFRTFHGISLICCYRRFVDGCTSIRSKFSGRWLDILKILAALSSAGTLVACAPMPQTSVPKASSEQAPTAVQGTV